MCDRKNQKEHFMLQNDGPNPKRRRLNSNFNYNLDKTSQNDKSNCFEIYKTSDFQDDSNLLETDLNNSIGFPQLTIKEKENINFSADEKENDLQKNVQLINSKTSPLCIELRNDDEKKYNMIDNIYSCNKCHMKFEYVLDHKTHMYLHDLEVGEMSNVTVSSSDINQNQSTDVEDYDDDDEGNEDSTVGIDSAPLSEIINNTETVVKHKLNNRVRNANSKRQKLQNNALSNVETPKLRRQSKRQQMKSAGSSSALRSKVIYDRYSDYCKTCKKGFETTMELMIHKVTTCETLNKLCGENMVIGCPVCGKRTSSNSNLQYHLRTSHSRYKMQR